MDIIDFHVHTGYDFHADEHGVLIDNGKFRSDLEACGVTKCCGSYLPKACSGRPVADYEQYIPELNAKAYETKELYGDFYIPGLHIHPAFVEMSCREIEKYARLGVKMIGELVPYMMGGTCYSDPRLIEILRAAADKGMVLSMHPNLKHPDDMEGLFRALPHMPIVVAHLDGYGLYDWSIDMMKKYDNLYFDISAHGIDREGMLKDAVQRVGASRILYGSDYPGYDSAPFINAVCEAGLTDKEQEAIFFENAASLLL